MKLRAVAGQVFGPSCILRGSKLSERRRVFSIAVKKGQQAVFVQVDGCLGLSGLQCDGLCLIQKTSNSPFVICLVELKGSDAEHGLKQLKATQEYLRTLTSCKSSGHKRKMRKAIQKSTAKKSAKTTRPAPVTSGHNGLTVGVLVGRRSIPRLAEKRKQLQKTHGLIVQFQRNAKGLTCAQIYSWVGIK